MPEKSTKDIPRALREQYEKGLSALQRNNLDYALAIFTQVLQKEPAFYDCREALRATQFKNAGGKSGFFKKLFGTAKGSPQITKAQMSIKSRPAEAMNVAEQILNGDPNNGRAHELLADAALVLDLPKTAVLSLEIVYKNSPKDKDVAVKLANALAQIGQVERGETILSELVKTNPGNGEILQLLKDYSARRTMSEGGYEAVAGGQGSYRDLIRDKEEATSLEQESRQVKSEEGSDRLIKEYEARLPNEPGNVNLLRSLAELYAQKKAYDTALSYYNKIIESEGANDPGLDRAIAEINLKKYDQRLAQLDPNAPDSEQKAAQIKDERQNYQLNECKKRAEKYPTDLQIRFELGQLYFQCGKLGEAIQEFQKAQGNPHKRLQAMSFLGQCFAQRGMFDLAARTLQNAIKEKPVFDDEKKDLIYALGTVLEKMGKPEEAIEQFKQIYEADIGYKDVAAKIDAYYAGK